MFELTNEQRNCFGSRKESMTMERIWKLTDTNKFTIALLSHLEGKTQYGDNLSVLSEAERIFYVTQTLEAEVSNGGFSQFFYNSSSEFSNEIVSAFSAIGAHATAEICQKAIDSFGREIPDDADEREELLDELLDDEEIEAVLEECDEAFYKYEEDLNELNYRFVMEHKESFR